MQNIVKAFCQAPRYGVTGTTAFWHRSMIGSVLNYIPRKTAYNSKEKELVRHKDRLLPFTPNTIWDNQGARKSKRRIGRGIGCSKGKTSGRGHKGKLARSGGSTPVWFEGGQTPLQDRLPKWRKYRGTVHDFNCLNVGNLLYYIRHGRLDASKTITIKDMYEAGVFPKIKYGVKILARGAHEIDMPLHLEVSDASESVIKAIKEKGGTVNCVYRTKLKMKEHVKPHLFPLELDDPLPAPKTVRKLEAIRERGAEVHYNEPDWVKTEREEGRRIVKENQHLDGFKIPADRSPGSGADKIRKRRPKLIKEIDYGLID